MHQTVEVPVVDLLLDQGNARLGQEQASQQQTAIALATQQGRRLVKLAESIVDDGLDPAQLLSVVATGDRRRKYTVVEGNRRILAIKSLETPSLVQGALSARDFKKLQSLSLRFASDPIEVLLCVLYTADQATEAYSRVVTRHAGAQEGAGLVEWDSDEKDRFAARHGSGRGRGTAGQVLDFLDAIDGKSAARTKITTTLKRIVSTPEVREKLGIDVVNGELVSWFPKDEVAKGLRKIVEDLRSETIKVPDVYTADQRKTYIDNFKRTQLPAKTKRLADAVKLSELPSGKATPVSTKPKKKSKASGQRTTIASSDANLNPGPPRINAVYNELLSLSAETYPNAGSVTLRVFLELSVDDYIERENVMTATAKRNANLAKRMKDVASHMEAGGKIDNDLKRAVNKIADSQHTIAASVTAFHQYVHNPYVHPKPSELRTSWDELQPFLEAVWA